MTYYTVSDPTTTAYVVTVGTSTWYTAFALSLLTWKSLSDINAKTWAILKLLGLTTWKKLRGVRGMITFYYLVADPTTTVYVVSKPTTTCYEVSV